MGGSAQSDPKSRSYLWTLFFAASLICSAYFIGCSSFGSEYKERLRRWQVIEKMQSTTSNKCQDLCRSSGSEALPQGIVRKTSDFKMRPLWNNSVKDNEPKPSMSLLALAVGIKQKEVVDQTVKKFPLSDFVVMLFHYDGVVDKWRDLPWSDHAIHVSAVNQTKWWFAKRFLHPDIVAEYDYIFLWDEDLGVENFNPRRYLSIVKDERLEISQPALDPAKSAVSHPITARQPKSRVHRRMYKFKGSGRCYHNSTSPPCIGWVEMMAPVFSKAAWRCVWYMIQNDLIHAWGLDFQLGYCAQGDRTKNVGVVDSEYIVHLGLLTLGVFNGTESNSHSGSQVHLSQEKHFAEPSESHVVDNRVEVRRQSYFEMQIFRDRWKNAVKDDKCWVDPFQYLANQTNN
ncbi:uncharacterized protein LOC110650723 isoform X3 [Hevea brasiliensis]|uniref:uncharacterized protein LOC110650723 isoform X3 n=1 Tax=Hevea brasiliensis TaxID=3981 RepID=UPI000B77D0D9|nr:uncharacterized protein LOC110650723 isoform X3 [Hevea brasiliensis]XP_058007157.1 uncharacterized protein LOC110650723 isoform X3 [Hevea brasiliensis]XP_058007158.1 uncharacterized protein LOC110650723 isoform X3 [Hevea brasiliensis]